MGREVVGASVPWEGLGQRETDNDCLRRVILRSVSLRAGSVVGKLLSGADEQSFAILRGQGVR